MEKKRKSQTDRRKGAANLRPDLEALRELSWLYAQARLWGKPRRFAGRDTSDLQQLSRGIVSSQWKKLDKIENAKRRLLATGYDAPPSWLTVRTVGELSLEIAAATDAKPEMGVLTDPGADLAALDTVLQEMYVAALKLEAKAGQKTIGHRTKPRPPPGMLIAESRCAPMKKTEIAARILNRTDKDVRPREVADKMKNCRLRDEGNGKWSIILNAAHLSREEIDRLNMTKWPPSPKI